MVYLVGTDTVHTDRLEVSSPGSDSALSFLIKRVNKRLPAVIPGRDWLFQVVTLGDAVPDEGVPGALGGGVIVHRGMREKRARQPTDLPLQD